MASCGSPTSTVGMLTWDEEMLPRVEPPARSARLQKVWVGTPAFCKPGERVRRKRRLWCSAGWR